MLALARHLGRVPPVVVDLALALGTAVLLVVNIVVGHDRGAAPPGPVTYLTAVLIAVPLLARRRYPLGVLLACAVLLFAFYTLSPNANLAPAVPLAVALYTCAEYGHLRWSLCVSTFYVAVGVYVLLAEKHAAVLGVLSDFFQEGSLLVAVCLLGDAVRSRRGWAGEIRKRVREAAAAAEAERERETVRRVAVERVRIARELHDILAHTISALTIQARVIVDGLRDDGPPRVRTAAEAILATSREAMAEVRATVGLLRAPDEPAAATSAPVPGVDQVEGLLATARATGLEAHLHTEGTPTVLPATVALAVYRIAQESLTNVVRHADARTATVTVRYLPDAVEVQIDDDGRGPSRAATTPPPSSGYGLLGIRERAAVLGGHAVTRAGPRGGFQVLARLPLAEPSGTDPKPTDENPPSQVARGAPATVPPDGPAAPPP
jgi:signal transduction histidine kinase